MSIASRKKLQQSQMDMSLLEVKSKFEAEFRRFSMHRNQFKSFDEFHGFLEKAHFLEKVPFGVWYSDPLHGDLLPINNTENCFHALNLAVPLLRLFLQRGDKQDGINHLNDSKRSNNFNPSAISAKQRLQISTPQDFRRVSAIIDVDILPESVRRVRLCKHLSDKPLGFYIRDGSSIRVTTEGLEKIPGIFVSRLVPGGLADSTGLLSVNDEVVEVNGIEVAGKSLDQVTEMMVANSHNLIVTVKPVNQIPTKQNKGTLEVRPSTYFPKTSQSPNRSHGKSGVIQPADMHTIDSDDEEPVESGGVVHV